MTPTQSPTPPDPALPFEEAMERLETIVEELEGGGLTLELSIARYEEGVKLARQLNAKLEEAEKRIERLVASENGATRTEPMDLGGGEAGEGEAPKRRREGSRRGSEELPF